MTLIDLVPDGGLVINASDLVEYVIPDTGMFTATPLPVPFLTLATATDLGTTTAKIGVTTDLVVDSSDILYFYVSTSATAPSTADLIDGTSSVAFGNDSTVTQGINLFTAIGLTENTTYYTHFYQTTSNGNSLVLTSASYSTEAEATVETMAPILNSLTSPESTIIRANVTTPNDDDHGTCLFYYRVYGHTVWIRGGQGLTVKNTTGTLDIISLTSGKTYEVMVIARDTFYKQSVPSEVFSVTVGTVQSEDELFLDNLEEIISQSSTFQTWTSTTNTTDAKAFIFKRWSDSPTGKYCIIDIERRLSGKISATGWRSDANLKALFIDDVVTSYETRDSQAEASTFIDNIGKISVELMNLEGNSGNLVIQNIEAGEPLFSDREMEDDDLTIEIELNIETGV